MEPSGKLLGVRWTILDDWPGFLESVEGVCMLGRFLVRRRHRCLLWSLWSVVEERAEDQVLLKGEVQASNLGRFGEKWSSVMKATLKC